jgi:hypothetical protein
MYRTIPPDGICRQPGLPGARGGYLDRVPETTGANVPNDGDVQRAGEGLSDEEMAQQVAEQTPSEERYADVFKREADGATTETEAAKASGDELAGD